MNSVFRHVMALQHYRKPALRTALPLLLLTLAWPCAALAADEEQDDLRELQTSPIGNEWVPLKNDRRHNIRTWIKQENGKRFRSFKVEATFSGTITDCVRILLDVPRYDKWYWEVLESRLVRKLSPTDYHIYLKHRAPHGVTDRDVPGILRFTPQSAENPTLVVQVRAEPDLMPKEKGFVRMEAEDMVLRLTPVSPFNVHLVAEGYVDPGGRAPGWAINFVQRSAPYSTLLGLKRMLEHHEGGLPRERLPFPIREYGE